MKIFLLVFLVAVVLAQFAIGIRLIFRVRDEARIGKLWAALRPSGGPGDAFTLGMLDGLPEPARRFLGHAIAPGTPLPRAVELRMSGSISPDGRRWFPLTADQIIAPGRGFIWRAKAVVWGPVTLRAIDHYADREARMFIAALNLVTMVNKTGADLARSAAGRHLAESVLVPAALLPIRGAAWEAIDARRARVRLAVDDLAAWVTLTIDDAGRLVSLVLPRWKEASKGRWEETPFGVFFDEETAFEGTTIPTRVRAGWWPETDKYQEFVRFAFDTALVL